MEEVTLLKLIDCTVLGRMLAIYETATMCKAFVVDPDGNVLANAESFCDVSIPFIEKYDIPLIMNGEILGYLVGGYMYREKPTKGQIFEGAVRNQKDFEEYQNLVLSFPVLSEEQIEKANESLNMLASIILDVCKGKKMMVEAAEEITRAANMKTDFLANMSHEIRTPMNAVIGMAEMALREDLTPAARDYINQIKSSGNALLNIINDILDFSKIESGKMSIQPVEYEPITLFYDVTNIIMTRLQDKNVELILNVTPNIPKVLYGDDQRIRQVLINLANNAVKFTNRGSVELVVDFVKLDHENIDLTISVKDTGIGIKEADLKRLFQSFQQVDSKRNRNIEGTGLGLAISKQLVSLMGGEISVQSKYEQGSTFSFHLPQKVVDDTPAIKVDSSENKVAIGFFRNRKIAKQFFADSKKMDVFSISLINESMMEDMLTSYKDVLKDKKIFLFYDEGNIGDDFKNIMKAHPEIQFILFTGFFSTKKADLDNLRIIHKPYSTMQICKALNNEMMVSHQNVDNVDIDFVAPDAKILIVDDNEINLKVAEGLLEPLQMNITTATSGELALECIGKIKYDLIFMDHMMPGLDGVETTRIIRRLHPEYDLVPILALTANTVGGTKDMFLSEGMNDMVAKPIEIREITSKIRKWLPQEMIRKSDSNLKEESKVSEDDWVIGDLDTVNARKMIKNDKVYMTLLKEYYKNIPAKAKKIKELQQKQDWKGYTIEVHSLKSLSRQIGATELGALASLMEKSGNAKDIQSINERTDEMIELYVSYVDVLKDFLEAENKDSSNENIEKMDVSTKELLHYFDQLKEAFDVLDMDIVDEIIEKMEVYSFDEIQSEYFEQLKAAASVMDIESCEVIIEGWKIEL